MSKHKMVVDIPHGPKELGAEITAEIAFSFLAGSPASQEDSGWPGELDFIDAAPIICGKPAPFPKPFERLWLNQLAEEWFWSDEGQAAAMEEVLAEAEDAREFIAELREGIVNKEMQAALEADGEKLRQMTGEDHGPYFEADRAIDGYEAAVQREMLAMAGKAAELRELLDAALDMLVVLAGITRDRRTRDAVLGEVEAMRAAAAAIRSRDERN